VDQVPRANKTLNPRSIPILPLSVLALLAALSYWLSQYAQVTDPRAQARLRHDPDLVVENLSAKKLNLSGDVQYTVEASKMLHFPDDDSSKMQAVIFTALEPGKPKLMATAPFGAMVRHDEHGDEVQLSGGVVVQSDADDKHQALRLTTPKLTIYPDKNIARSIDGALLTSPTGQLTAGKFELNSLTRIIVFERVNATYQHTK
jgi:lipopolysaccharide export system protein LptC